jgi:hypothetical protein
MAAHLTLIGSLRTVYKILPKFKHLIQPYFYIVQVLHSQLHAVGVIFLSQEEGRLTVLLFEVKYLSQVHTNKVPALDLYSGMSRYFANRFVGLSTTIFDLSTGRLPRNVRE